MSTYSIASVWVCMPATDQWTCGLLIRTPRISLCCGNGARRDGDWAGGGVVLRAHKAAECCRGDEKRCVKHVDVRVNSGCVEELM